MPDTSSYEGFRELVVGILIGAVTGLLALVRKLDVGEIDRRLERLEEQVEKLREGKQRGDR